MKSMLTLLFCFTFLNASSQNILINILSHNAGVAEIGESMIIEVTICNTDAVESVAAYKLRPQVNVPSDIVAISRKSHKLPEGWEISSIDSNTIRLTNGHDQIPPNVCRTAYISITGKTKGGPSIISGTMLFSNGQAPGSQIGSSAKNDNTADNSSTTTCTIIKNQKHN